MQTATNNVAESYYEIEGGHRLTGHVSVQGAKNAVSKQIVASVLTAEPCTFTNVPRITEIDVILEMLAEIGGEHRWEGESTLTVQTPEIKNTSVSQKYSGFNRIPILLLAPMLHRAKYAVVPKVGGCLIGPRPVDFHIAGLSAMGAQIESTENEFRGSSDQLVGTHIHLDYPSVGATENIVMAATLAQGTTVISGAAVEPEIVDTILFLQKMGALIYIDVDRRIVIEGVKKLSGATHHTITDRIEVASLATAAVATDGHVTVEHAQQESMVTFLNVLCKSGGGFTVDGPRMSFFRKEKDLKAVHVETDVHPGFMTDWQQPLVVLLTQAQGTSIVHETVYEDRFGYTKALIGMGADIELSKACLGSKSCRLRDKGFRHSCIVRGPVQLNGSTITIPDLRAGFAYVNAALIAKGVSTIYGTRYLERGYSSLPDKLQSIGAHVKVVRD